MRIAYFGYPHTGGTYSVFKQLRRGLMPYGVKVEWLGIAATDRTPDTERGGAYESELKVGGFIGDASDTEAVAASRFCRFLDDSPYDAIVVNVLANRVQMNAIRYIRPSLARLLVVHSTSPATYEAAQALRDFVHATIAVSPRIARDLINHHGFVSDSLFVVPTGVEVASMMERVRNSEGPLRVVYLGRVRDYDKGVLWLPRIAQLVPPGLIRLRVAGDGEDMLRLKALAAQVAPQIEFLGRVNREGVRALLLESDVMLMPSRFEGLGIALIEAMACGVVPVASRITGVTDFVSPDGDTGYLFPIGDVRAAARRLIDLAYSPSLVADMSVRARARVATNFSVNGMALGYREALECAVDAASTRRISTLSLESWTYPRGLRPSLRSRLPSWLKNRLRVLRERLAQ